LAYINRNYPVLLDLRLSTKDYWDFQVSEYAKICNCEDINTPLFCVLFNDIQKNCADDVWVEASVEAQTIPDFGITGYDNRFLPDLEADLVLDGDKHFCLTAVDGDNFCYSIQSGTPVQLCGGFFQGFYKLQGVDYQVLPAFFKDGWTAEFYLLKSGCTCEGSPSLNETYPNNEGIFYYIGTRAENKFCSLKEHLLGYEVQSGITFLESVIKDQSHITPPSDVNPFLFFNSPSLCEYETELEFDLPDCCDGLKYNALAFRITEEGRIGYRYLATSGTCVDRLYQEDFVIREKYSEEAELFDTQYHLVTIKFQNYEHFECTPNRQTFGVLSIYVDGFLKLREYDFPNIVPYAFEDLATKQYGVPFNISVGGGTQGLLEMQNDPPTEYNVCNYRFYLKKNQFLKGIKVDGVDYFTPEDYGYYDEQLILDFLNPLINEKFASISTKQTQNYLEFTLKLVVNDFQSIYYSVEIDTGTADSCCDPNLPDYSQSIPYKTDCFSFTTNNDVCGILEDNFAGTFFGFIQSYCLYDKPLSLENIRCNYQNLYL
jgi:hypothetical protein